MQLPSTKVLLRLAPACCRHPHDVVWFFRSLLLLTTVSLPQSHRQRQRMLPSLSFSDTGSSATREPKRCPRRSFARPLRQPQLEENPESSQLSGTLRMVPQSHRQSQVPSVLSLRTVQCLNFRSFRSIV